MSQQHIELKTGSQNLWAVFLFVFCLFGSCSSSSPSNYEKWLHAAYGYKIDGKTYSNVKDSSDE